MKAFAQFWQLSTGLPLSKPEPIHACGDRAVIILDGRNTSDAWHAIAADEAKKRGYIGYTIHKGERFDAPAACAMVSVQGMSDLETASRRALRTAPRRAR